MHGAIFLLIVSNVVAISMSFLSSSEIEKLLVLFLVLSFITSAVVLSAFCKSLYSIIIELNRTATMQVLRSL